MTEPGDGGRPSFRPRVLPVETVAYRSELLWIGGFRCPADHPLFVDSGPASAHFFSPSTIPATSTAARGSARRATSAIALYVEETSLRILERLLRRIYTGRDETPGWPVGEPSRAPATERSWNPPRPSWPTGSRPHCRWRRSRGGGGQLRSSPLPHLPRGDRDLAPRQPEPAPAPASLALLSGEGEITDIALELGHSSYFPLRLA
jgi:hypothetical protein